MGPPRLAALAAGRPVIGLLWFDPSFAQRIRSHPDWKDILRDKRPRPSRKGPDSGLKPSPEDEIAERREIAAILSKGRTHGGGGVDEAIAAAVDDDATFVPPLVLVEGELELLFEPLEILKATLLAASPFTESDKRLKDTVDSVNKYMQAPWLPTAEGLIKNLIAELVKASTERGPGLPPLAIEAGAERILLEQRRYRKRTVLGQAWLVALMALDEGSQPMPVYLPESLGAELPMFRRLHVRLIAEVHAQLDQYEAHPNALRAVALGRVLAEMGRR
jgi:hypothetical protein